jgi:hypothetical protein
MKKERENDGKNQRKNKRIFIFWDINHVIAEICMC